MFKCKVQEWPGLLAGLDCSGQVEQGNSSKPLDVDTHYDCLGIFQKVNPDRNLRGRLIFPCLAKGKTKVLM